MKSIRVGRILIAAGAILLIAGFVAWQKGAPQPFGLYRQANATPAS
jgi:hypothetical protein